MSERLSAQENDNQQQQKTRRWSPYLKYDESRCRMPFSRVVNSITMRRALKPKRRAAGGQRRGRRFPYSRARRRSSGKERYHSCLLPTSQFSQPPTPQALLATKLRDGRQLPRQDERGRRLGLKNQERGSLEHTTQGPPATPAVQCSSWVSGNIHIYTQADRQTDIDKTDRQTNRRLREPALEFSLLRQPSTKYHPADNSTEDGFGLTYTYMYFPTNQPPIPSCMLIG